MISRRTAVALGRVLNDKFYSELDEVHAREDSSAFTDFLNESGREYRGPFCEAAGHLPGRRRIVDFVTAIQMGTNLIGVGACAPEHVKLAAQAVLRSLAEDVLTDAFFRPRYFFAAADDISELRERLGEDGYTFSGGRLRHVTDPDDHSEEAGDMRRRPSPEQQLRVLVQNTGAPVSAAPPARDEAQEQQDMRVQVFVSHSSKDEEVVSKLVALLHAGLEIPEEALRCTSVDGYGLQGGDDAPEALRRDLQSCNVVIVVATASSMESHFVMLELGAAWALRKKAIPVVGLGAKLGALPAPFGAAHALRLEHSPAMATLPKAVAACTALKPRNNEAKLTKALQELSEAVTKAKG